MASAELLLPLIGVLIGGGLTIGGQLFIERRKSAAERRVLAHAIAAEIDSHLSLMEKRGHVQRVQRDIKMNQEGKLSFPKHLMTEHEKARDPLPVIAAALPRIGLLRDQCTDVVKFYRQVHGVRTTLIGLDEGKYDHVAPPDAVKILESETALWEDTVALGNRTVVALKAVG